MSQTVAKLRPMTAVVGGVTQTIFVLATASPDGLIGIIDCGEYDPARIYNLMNLVSRTSGSNQGTWLYISATPSTGASGTNPTVDPWVNSNGSWRALFPANTNDQWM